ncbi:EAL domain-containing protein [Pseudomonas resinovorans]|uniref:cyclic-guanylate-specific phosphodiesterase n=1 Tax=Metapseudomonas resinovorans TaxID=53412 RepID=A0ABT4YBL9_METRE|nr:EAL domain-containing protein [Pseudomonas resinovorans]MDA8486282.1 EAL domain-containing protein [Pseudomonas resinovorans]
MTAGPRTWRATARLLTLTIVIASTAIAWVSAETLSTFYVTQRLKDTSADIRSSLRSVSEQIEQALSDMQRFEQLGSECTSGIYAAVSNLVAANRFIYEAAVLLPNGKACTSYGYQLESLAMLQDTQPFSTGNHSYWFSVSNLSGNEGFVAVSQHNSYVWLNDLLVASALDVPNDVTFELVDKNSLDSLFSSSEHQLKHEIPYQADKISVDRQGVHYALPSQWQEILAVVTLPFSAYQTIWWQLFTTAFLSSLAVIGLLTWVAGKIREQRRSFAPKLRRALKYNEFRVNYQPIVNMHTGRWVGVESLIRWHVAGKAISPAIFIPAAEKEGVIGEITHWVIERIAEDYSHYLRACEGLYLTINLSAQEIEDESFPSFVQKTLETHGVPASLIVFEVTEGGLVNLEKATAQLQKLRDQGHRIAVDDFGTGYSSLSYIETLPIDILKIDRSFLTPEKIAANDALWRHVVSMANTLNLTVVAEGIEGTEQSEPLMREGVTFAQGWLYSRDLSPAALKDEFLKLHQECA